MTQTAAFSVAHVLWQGGVGGIERLVGDVAQAQAARGERVAVAVAAPDEGSLLVRAPAQVSLLRLPVRSGYDVSPRRLVRAARTLSRYDVLHLHGFNVPLALATLLSRRPFLFTEHGNFGLGRPPRMPDRVKRSAQRRFLRRAALVTANSLHTARRMEDLYRIRRGSVFVVHNGTRFSETAIAPRSSAPEQPLVAAFVGRLVSFKRVDRFLRALALTEGRTPPRALIVGGGPLEGQLTLLAKQLGISNRVTFLGYRDDVEQVLDQVDVLVHPSQDEPFGLAIVEACGRGVLPCVFTDGGGAVEVVPPDARVVATVEELSAALTGLTGSSELGFDARVARARWAREQFPIEKTIDSYAELYRRVLEHESPRS